MPVGRVRLLRPPGTSSGGRPPGRTPRSGWIWIWIVMMADLAVRHYRSGCYFTAKCRVRRVWLLNPVVLALIIFMDYGW